MVPKLNSTGGKIIKQKLEALELLDCGKYGYEWDTIMNNVVGHNREQRGQTIYGKASLQLK